MMTREPDFVDECYADKDLSLLKKLTLVIPTYNRNNYLSRCLWYHAHFPFGEIIVADSSLEAKKALNRETVSKVRETFGANIRYLEYEPETEKYGGDIYRKWGDAVQHVETEYSQICTDKEFVLPVASCENVKFLEINDEYGFSDGQYFYLYNSVLYKNKYCLITATPNRKTINFDDNINRLLDALFIQRPWENTLLLSLSKTSIIKKLYKTYSSTEISDIRYGEIFLGYGGYIHEKYNNIQNLPSKIRDLSEMKFGKEITKSESSSSRYPTLTDYLFLEIGNKFYLNYKSYIINELNLITINNKYEILFKNYLTKDNLLKYDSLQNSQQSNKIIKIISLIWWYLVPTFVQDLIMTYLINFFKMKIVPSHRININKNTEIEAVFKLMNYESNINLIFGLK